MILAALGVRRPYYDPLVGPRALDEEPQVVVRRRYDQAQPLQQMKLVELLEALLQNGFVPNDLNTLFRDGWRESQLHLGGGDWLCRLLDKLRRFWILFSRRLGGVLRSVTDFLHVCSLITLGEWLDRLFGGLYRSVRCWWLWRLFIFLVEVWF